MTDERWFDVIARMTPDEPLDLDAVVFGRVARADPGEVAPRGRSETLAPSARLWERDTALSHIGVRVTRAHPDALDLAFRLASAAAERGVVPVILSPLERTGFERFGFRVERLPADPPEEAARAEQDLMRFWDMPIVIDLADVAHLG